MNSRWNRLTFTEYLCMQVTVRAYSVVGESEGEGPKTTVTSCKVSSVETLIT